ncbi:MAG: ABC transporter substrate-binding protein [Aphanocapsa lilacina HA4352-LM1]|jgi:ABC-type nitrate/sulfonate/bicarbonate transport system substrate-binding protein|nr:ABC transporter substrate-binding protein [Aphanocapsa lilacina HA4352-LM1]
MAGKPLGQRGASAQAADFEQSARWKPTRRQFLQVSGAASAGLLLAPGYAGAADAPEVTAVRIGFVGQTDASPIIIAKVKGYFEKHGLKDVELIKQPSWGVTRDNLELGSGGGGLDVAMVLRPMPFLMALGANTKGNKKIPMYMPLQLNVDGQGITVAKVFNAENVRLDASVMKPKIEKAKAEGKKLKFASTFKGGTSDLMLRYWLAAGGIDPDNDIDCLYVPGPQLVASMKVGNLEGFCVGDPWHERAISEKIGYSAVISGELWKDHPEKALAMRADWADKHPKAARAILKGIMEAQQWCDVMTNRDELCTILSSREYANVQVADINNRLKGSIEYGNNRPVVSNSPYVMRFWRENASYPYKSHDLWFMTENIRWNLLPAATDVKAVVGAVNRADLWQQAAKEGGIAAAQIPKVASRGVEVFFDKTRFDPANTTAYLKALKIKRVALA